MIEAVVGLGFILLFDALFSGGKTKSTTHKPQITTKRKTLPGSEIVELILYHGTPAIENTRKMVEQGLAFIIGAGNVYGTGVYMTTNRETAKVYAKKNGAILELRLTCPESQIADYASVWESKDFQDWWKKSGIDNKGDAISSYCVNELHKRYLNVDGSTYVAMTSKTAVNERVVFEGLDVVEITDYRGNVIEGGSHV